MVCRDHALTRLKPLSDTVGNTLDDLQQAATAADGELDAVLCASDAPSSNDARRQLAQQYAATLARLEQLLPVLRALLLRARRYAQLEARRGVEDMAAASRGQQSSWEAGHTVVRDAVAPWEVADQADARHVKSILRSALALLEDDVNGGFEDPAITATATLDQRFRARIEALLQHREQVMAAQAAAHKRITEADQVGVVGVWWAPCGWAPDTLVVPPASACGVSSSWRLRGKMHWATAPAVTTVVTLQCCVRHRSGTKARRLASPAVACT